MDILQRVSNNEGLYLTPIRIDEEYYFLPQELGEQLGYKNLSKSISENYKENVDYIVLTGSKLLEFKGLINQSISNGLVGKHSSHQVLLTESGLYAVLLRSNKPFAEKFRVWVTSEVLPSIRKKGSYSLFDITTNRYDDILL